MGIAANAVADFVGPPAPRAAASAGGDESDAPSFQDHIEANDRTQARTEQADRGQDRESAAQPRSTQLNDQSQSQQTTSASNERRHEEDTKASPAHPPFLLQLITNIAASTAAKADPQVQAQSQGSQSAPAEQAATQAGAAQGGVEAALVAPKSAAKTDVGVRSAAVKGGKAVATKTETAQGATPTDSSGDASATLQDQSPQAVLATPTIAVQDTQQADTKTKSEALESVQAGGTQARRQQQSAGPQPLAPEAPPQPDAKPRADAKMQPQASSLKQAAQDFVLAAPKIEASTPAPTAPAVTHAQLASPIEQTMASSTDSRAQTAPVAAQVGGEIIRRFNGQDTSFHLRLDPPDLGRVDVRLDVSRDHRVTAVISADTPQALSDLARGARDLQQALQSAGLDLADDGLRFDLSSNGQGGAFAQSQAQQDRPDFSSANTAQTEKSIAPERPASRPLSIDSWRGARVDLVA